MIFLIKGLAGLFFCQGTAVSDAEDVLVGERYLSLLWKWESRSRFLPTREWHWVNERGRSPWWIRAFSEYPW